MANSVAVGLADNDGARRLQPLHGGGVVGRNKTVQDAGRRRRAHPAYAEVVLDGDRHACQWTGRLARRAPSVNLPGAGERAIGSDEVEGVERRVDRFDTGEEGAADLEGPTLDRSRSLRVWRARCPPPCQPPITRGTRNSPASRAASGALPSASAGDSESCGSSSRSVC